MGKVFVHDQTQTNVAIKGPNSKLTVNCPVGSTVYAMSGEITRAAVPNGLGKAVFVGLPQGTWDIIVQNGANVATETIEIVTDYEITMKFFEATVTITYPAGSTCRVTDGKSVYSAPDTSGTWTRTLPSADVWTASCTNGSQTTTCPIVVSYDGQKLSVKLAYFAAYIDAIFPEGAACICTNGNYTYEATSTSGSYKFTVPETGTWTVTATDGIQTVSNTVSITADGQTKSTTIKFFKATVNVTYPKGAICSCKKDSFIYSASDTTGSWTFNIPSIGVWTISATDGVQTVSQTVTVTSDGQSNNVTIKFFEATINITYPAGATCTCTDGISNYKAPNTSGVWTVKVPRLGTWIVKAVDGSNTTTQHANITADGQTVNIKCEFFISYINVTYPPESFKVVLLATDPYGNKVESASDTSGSGSCRFIIKQSGDYEVVGYRVEPYVGIEGTAGDYASEEATISASGETISITLSYNTLPEFTYTGTYKIVDDAGGTINASNGDWNIIFTTSGVFKATKLNGAKNGIDVFVVGGGGNGGSAIVETYGGSKFSAGGGGGGGGYRENVFNVKINEGTGYEVKIGSGGGSSSAFGVNASSGGNGGTGRDVGVNDGGGLGGSGGSSGGRGHVNAGLGGSNGEDGSYPFLGTTGLRYGPGGGGGYSYNGGADLQSNPLSGGKDGGGDSSSNATANSGGGGGGGSYKKSGHVSAGTGGSGIAMIRNKR